MTFRGKSKWTYNCIVKKHVPVLRDTLTEHVQHVRMTELDKTHSNNYFTFARGMVKHTARLTFTARLLITAQRTILSSLIIYSV